MVSDLGADGYTAALLRGRGKLAAMRQREGRELGEEFQALKDMVLEWFPNFVHGHMDFMAEKFFAGTTSHYVFLRPPLGPTAPGIAAEFAKVDGLWKPRPFSEGALAVIPRTADGRASSNWRYAPDLETALAMAEELAREPPPKRPHPDEELLRALRRWVGHNAPC